MSEDKTDLGDILSGLHLDKTAMTTFQFVVLAKALKRLAGKVEKSEFDRQFLSDAVLVIGYLFLLLGISKPDFLDDVKSLLNKIAGGD